MKVYQIDRDLNNMRGLYSKKVDSQKQINWFRGISMNDFFIESKEKFVLEKIKAKYMDFYASEAQLVLTSKSYTILGNCLREHGEIFKCRIENASPPEDFAYFFNILTKLDPYDKEKTVWDIDSKGFKMRPIRPVFLKNKVKKSMFIIPKGDKNYGNYWEIFCTDGLLPPEEEFYHIYQNSGLKGLRFKEIELT